MAEFKLGRIKFVWQGEWQLGNTYVVDDVVTISGKSYICVINHTAGVTDNTFAGDLNIVGAPKWELLSDGTEWNGNWQASHYYDVGSVVKYGGRVYVCKTAHTSATNVTPTWLGLEQDQNKWDVFAESINWRNGWEPATKYSVNDFVSNDGYTYICNEAHISAADNELGLEDDLEKWDVVNQGFIYHGDWVGEVRYHVNDLVKYGASTWICTSKHLATTSFDDTKWAIFVEGLEFESSWSDATIYQPGDVVTYGGYSYIAKTNNTGSNPSTGENATTDWSVYTTGFNFRSDYVDSTAYKVGDVIRLNGYTYLCIEDTTGNVPPDTQYWNRLNAGVYWTNPEQTYTAVASTTLTGVGSNATFNVTRTNAAYTVTVANGGSEFVVGDKVKILGTSLGGLSPANDLTLTVASENLNTIVTVTTEGYSSTWTSGHVYVEGDITFWGANSYICVASHTASSGNRPDNDTVAEFWNLLAAGAEEAVLTMEGDTVYYSQTGPTRLPIGTDGQILRVRNGYPEWSYYGVVNNVVYVAPSGTNSEDTGWGLTVDKPWASVRYACDQVRKGYLNRNAAELLRKNKQFIMKEVSAWIDYTYSVSVTSASAATNEFTVTDSTDNLTVGMPIEFDGTTGGVVAGTKYFVKEVTSQTTFKISETQTGIAKVLTNGTTDMVGTLSYDHSYCERDTGILVDAVVYDISHGGTDEITKCAKAYYTKAGADYINSNFGQQTVQTIAAYNYLKEIVVNVLSNTPPKMGYQVANGVRNGATQIIDTSLTAETGTGEVTTNLLSIVTDGIAAGEVTSIPASVLSNTSIFVKTGTYFEILPIIIPKNTAVVGDELRGTVVSPNRGIVNLVKDKPKTISALNRIKSVITNIVANNTVVPTSGNTTAQQYIYNNYESIVAPSTRSNISVMADIVTNGSTSAPSLTLSNPSNIDIYFANARDLIIGNEQFLKDEVTAYMVANYTSLWTDIGADNRDKCTRDIGYIVDALAYDLTYGGNLETVVAARSYYTLGTFVEPSNQKTAALAVQGYLKSIIGHIITKNTSWSKLSATVQYTTGSAGDANAQSFAEDRIQEMYDTINTGTAPTEILPDASWASSAKVAAHTTLQNAKATIQAQAIAWINENYPALVYNEALCSRDVGYMLDALCYDMVFGVNFRSVKAALAYFRALTSTAVVLDEQLEPTVGMINYLGLLVEMHTAGTNMLNTCVNTMTDIIAHGDSVAPSFVWNDPTDFDTGYYNARRLVLANKAFLKAEVSAWINAQILASTVPFNGFVYTSAGQTACERDIGYIVDALAYDLTYGGNLATQIAARAYYSNGVLVEAGEEAQALAVQVYLKSIIDNIVTGSAITKSAGNAETQVTSGTAGSAGAGSFAQDRIQEIHDTIDTGTEPVTVAPSLTWVASDLTTANTNINAVKAHIQSSATDWVNEAYPDLYYNTTTCQRDVGYIVDALRYDMMFGTNFLSIQNAKSYYRSLTSTAVVTSQQLHPTLSLLGFVGASVKEIVSGTTQTLGRVKAATRIEQSADTMFAIVQDGVSLAPNEYMPDPSNLDSNYEGARHQIDQNYDFIKAEVSAFINGTYTALWSDLGAEGQASCQRDVGYILDALRYDLTYGGNTQSLIVGASYYSYINLVIADNEKTATLAAYGRLRDVIDNICRGEASGTTWTKTAGNLLSQTATGSKDTVGTAASFAAARVQDIIDWIANGTAPATISPNTDWVDSGLVEGFNALQAKKSEIKQHGLGFINKFHQDLSFNETTCSRDIGYMIDAMGYDMMFGSNFASVIVGRSYYRALSSTAIVLANQKQASLDLIRFLKHKAKGIAVAGGAIHAVETINDIVDTINGGATPAISWPDYDTIDADYQAARTLISDNKEFFKEEVIAYIAANYSDISYNRETCSRDVGLIVDALAYDMAFGSNFASVKAGMAYLRSQSYVVTGREKEATISAMGYLKTLVSEVVYGNVTAVSSVEDNMDTIIDIITNGSGSVPAFVYPDPTGYNTTYLAGYGDARAQLVANKAFIVDEITEWIADQVAGPIAPFTGGFTYDSAACARDVGYLVDAMLYDLTYGGNYQTLVAANAYYTFGTAMYGTGEKDEVLAAYTHLKAVVGYVITENTGWSKATALSQDTSGTAGTATFAQARVQEIIDTITNDGTLPTAIDPSITWADAELQTKFGLLQTEKARLQGYVVNFVNEAYAGYDFNQTTCARDVGYIVDALHYDLTYGGNLATRQVARAYYSGLSPYALQIDTADKTATLAVYGYLKTLVTAVAQDSAVGSPYQTNVAQVRGIGGTSTEATAAGDLVQDIIDTITSLASLPAAVDPGTSWVDSDLLAKQAALTSAKSAIVAAVTLYIGTNYPNLEYDSATCERDVGYIVDAIGWDMVLNSNYQSIKAGMSYYRVTAALVLSDQKFPTLDAMRYLKGLIGDRVEENATALARANANMDIIIDIADKGVGSTPETTGTITYNNSLGISQVAELLRANKSFLESEATAWISDYFGGHVVRTTSVTNVVETRLAHHLKVGDTIQFIANEIEGVITAASSTTVTLKSTAGMYAGQKFATVVGSTIGNITSGTTYYIKEVLNTSQVTLSTVFDGDAFDAGSGSGMMTVTVGATVGTIIPNVQYYVLTVPSLTTFTFGETVDGTAMALSTDKGSIHVQYYYDETSCRRDMGAYIDAIIEDLSFTGNHASIYAATIYNNAVGGSEMSDMYWVSNASGLRNQTMTGLNGQLTSVNAYGTKRPTAGAFVALNPGFGPDDSRVWVTTRSHYSQNCTMFGTGCTGAKIDSALHAGGNKSMVKNDFTTIISDGIGVWCTGSGSLTELVSVFNYYGYAGYLAEKGGRIRATNGNSSYGTYGVIAEGVDSKETPIYGTVNNQAYDAQIGQVITDSTTEVLRVEYSNAGQNYSNSIFTISGTGYNVSTLGDEFRDNAVFETRIIDLDNGNGYGGTNYASIANAAQDGTAVSITIAATDTALTNAYVGMRIQITGGTGAGQYANILTYIGGSKFAQVYKDSFTTLTVTGSTASADTFTVASTATLYADMPIYFQSAIGGASANTLYYVKTVVGATTFTISTEAGGALFDVTADSSGQTVSLLAAGWDHVVPGTTIESFLDLTTTYIIEPRIQYTAPGYTATARSLSGTTTWNKLTYGDDKFVAIPTTGTATSYSADGTTWATAGALSSSTSWVDVAYGGGMGATATAIVGGLGGRGAVLEAVFGVPNTTGAATETQIASVNVIDGGQGYTTPPVIEFTAVSGGSGAKATATVLDGKIVSVTVTIPGSGYNALPTVEAKTDRVTKIVVNTWGRGFTSDPTITITGGGSPTVTATATASRSISGVGTIDGVYEILLVDSNAVVETNASYLGFSGEGYTETPTVVITDSNAKYVAVAADGTNCYTTREGIAAGSTWTAGTTMAGSPTIVATAYGSQTGIFVGLGTATAYSSTDGISWSSRTIPTLGAGTYSALCYGANTFVAVATGTVETAISTNGTSWTTGGNLTNATTWTSIAYGNGRFVALAATGRVAISIDKGTTWKAVSTAMGTTASVLSSSYTWTRVGYGQGLFFAIASGTSVCATSPDGMNWTVRAMSSSSNWSDVQFGNPLVSGVATPLWTAISSTSGVIGCSMRTGAQALGRVKVTGGVVSELRMAEPGSGYPKGTVSATTTSTNIITVDNTTNLVLNQPIEFFGTSAGGLVEEKTYYVKSIPGATQITVSETAGGTTLTLSTASVSGMIYRAGPTVTIIDPNNVTDVATRVRLGDGALGNPTFLDRGADNATATGEVLGDGYSDLYQASTFINVAGLSEAPQAGANVEFASMPGLYFKLVTVTQVVGDGFGNYTATFQVNPGITVLQAPRHGDLITTRLKYSQVRLTGHDFLYVGTGGYTTTNFPGTPLQAPNTAQQELYSAGGRVFFTSTDQDGNFNVGNLFGVQQATGTATLNASAFNLSGLNSLQLGSVELGIGSAIITQFSTDPYFTANSDNIVPTQRAIKAYITSQIGGGQSSLNVNTLTSGVVYVAGNSISTTTGVGINVTTRLNFTGGIDGAPVALGFFMQR